MHENVDTATAGDLPKGGIQALDAALHVLKTLATFPGPVSLSDLARRTQMPATKVHRYLASFVGAGFVSQRGRTGKYDLGPEAARLGLASIARIDFVNAAADHLQQLAEATGLTALLTVWGTHGPIVVRWERTRSLTVTSMGLGSTLPLLTSASGRIFLAYLPRRLTEALIEQEISYAHESGYAIEGVDLAGDGINRLIERIRASELAFVDGGFIPGLRAVAAPILNWQGGIEASIALIGASGTILLGDSAITSALKAVTEQISLAPQK
jgi:DNA-binding IclR family transcriptional regulator